METSAVKLPQCPYCGALPHENVTACPLIKSISYYPDGRIQSVVKHDPPQHDIFEQIRAVFRKNAV